MSFIQKCRKIVAIGRNFANHAKELGNQVPTEPIIFLKPPTSLLTEGNSIELPPNADIHHEVELAVVISKKGRNIRKQDAFSFVEGYAVALDLTARCSFPLFFLRDLKPINF